MSRSFVSRLWSSLHCLCLAICLFLLGTGSAEATTRNVLLLNSYHPTYSWTANIVQGVRETIELAPDVELSIDFMDTKKASSPEYFKQLSQLLAQKYGAMRFDLIICSDDDALSFLLDYRDRLFPKVPVVFCGINNFNSARTAGHWGFTGVNEANDINRGVELILNLHPRTRRLVMVHDQSATGLAMRRQFDALGPRWGSRLEFTPLTDMSTSELSAKVAEVSSDSVIVWGVFMKDADGKPLSPRQSLRLVVGAAKVPVYSFWDFAVIEGAVGGYVVSGLAQGRAAAKMGRRILSGEPVEQISPLMESPNDFLFDFPAIQRWGIAENQLPKDAVLLHRPTSFYEAYKHYVWAALGGMGVETLVIVVLLGVIRTTTRKSRAKLKESEDRYRSIVEDGTELIIRATPAGRLLFANGATARNFDLEPQAIEQYEARDLLPIDACEVLQRSIQTATPENNVFSLEHEIQGSHPPRYLHWTVRCFFDAQGKQMELQAVGRDITERKQAELAVQTVNQALQGVLDGMIEPLLVTDLSGRLTGVRSLAATRAFGKVADGTLLWDYLLSGDTDQAANLELALEQLAQDSLPFEVSVDQLPRLMSCVGRSYRIGCTQDRRGDTLVGLIFVLTDVTAALEQERVEQLHRELPVIVGNMLHDRDGFQSFIEETESIFTHLVQPMEPVELKRLLHTLKGNTAIYGFSLASAACHALEAQLQEEAAPVTVDAIHAIEVAWRRSLDNIKVFLSKSNQEAIDLGTAEYQALVAALENREDYGKLLRLVKHWVNPPMSRVLGIYGRTVQQLAKRFSKEVEVDIRDHGLRLPRAEMRWFLSVLVHAVRNAIDHGVETPEERVAVGKPRKAKVVIESIIDRSQVVVAVEDDGRGIDWNAIRSRAQALGIPAETSADLVDALFTDGLSTRAEATDISGRGVGLAAVLQSCRALGGVAEVASKPGKGARFEFRFTLPSLLPESGHEASGRRHTAS